MKTPVWKARSGLVRTRARHFGLMGILNVTPDSFYDGGSNITEREWIAKAGELWRGGADLLDIGAESTRPGADAVPPEMELARLLPAVESIRKEIPQAVISIDTRNSSTARASLLAGADVINDVSAMRHDPSLLEVLAQYQPGYVLTHSQGEPKNMQSSPRYDNIVDEISSFFELGMSLLVRAGFPEDHIVLDPGIGFGKKLDHNLEILKKLEHFLTLGRPLLIGLSMKSLFADLLGHGLKDRACDTVVATVLCWEKGVFWHRVHKVDQARDALRLACVINSAL